MLILGIETSCDETAAAVVENGTLLHSSVVASSQDMHAKYGGIIPDKAAREQLKSIIPVIHEALTLSGLQSTDYRLPPKVDAIAVTIGPGLIGSLLIGVETAKTLALAWNKPLIPINHLVGHIYANWIKSSDCEPPQFPALVLLVSGGHSDLVLMTGHGKFEPLGSTRDDAAGECFDKCGRVLGLPYPYGPFIEKAAEGVSGKQIAASNIKLPRPLSHSGDYDFSFSGLKTAFLTAHKKLGHDPSSLATSCLAYELQEAITDSLVTKTLAAAKEYKPKSIVLAGGVAANKILRQKLLASTSHLQPSVKLYIPPTKLCTDNAAYIAASAYYNNHPLPINQIEADPSLTLS